MDKVVESAADAVADIGDGVTLATGGFGVCGIPSVLLKALQLRGSRDITLISNNCGIAGVGNSLLLENRQLSRLIASYVGENKELERQYLYGEVDIELTPRHSGRAAARRGLGHRRVLHAHRVGHSGRRRRAADSALRDRRRAGGLGAEADADVHCRRGRARLGVGSRPAPTSPSSARGGAIATAT